MDLELMKKIHNNPLELTYDNINNLINSLTSKLYKDGRNFDVKFMDMFLTKELMEFLIKEKFFVQRHANFGINEIFLNAEKKEVFSGVYGFTKDNLTFFIVSVKDGDKNYFRLVYYYDDLKTIQDLFSTFSKQELRVLVPGFGMLPIKDAKNSKDLIGIEKLDDISDNIEKFIKTDFYKKNELAYVSYFLFSGQEGSGKSTLVKSLIKKFGLSSVTMPNQLTPELFMQMFKSAEDLSPSALVLDYIDEWLGQVIDYSLFFQALNNFKPKNGCIIIATAENKQNLAPELLSFNRFNKVYDFDLPKESSINKHLKSLNFYNDKKNKAIAKKCVQNNFTWNDVSNIEKLHLKTIETGDKVDPLEIVNTIAKENKLLNKQINFDQYLEV